MREKSALACSLLAVAWGIVLLVGALTFPAYQGRSVTVACPGCPPIVEAGDSRTLVEVNGRAVLVPVSLPLLLAVASTLLLRRHRRGASHGGYIAAWVLIGLLAAFAVLALFSIGALVVPVAALLGGAALLSHRPREA